MAPDGRILGESVINEIDWDLRCANFRIAIVHPTDCGQGIGTWAAEVTRDFAFEKLKRHCLERKAYSFHPRAEKHIGKPDSIKRVLCGTPFRMESNTPTLFRWQCGRTGDGEKRPQSRRRPAGRPTDLLLKRIPSPKPSAAGTVVFAAAVFMLLPGKNGKAAAGRSTGGG